MNSFRINHNKNEDTREGAAHATILFKSNLFCISILNHNNFYTVVAHKKYLPNNQSIRTLNEVYNYVANKTDELNPRNYNALVFLSQI